MKKLLLFSAILAMALTANAGELNFTTTPASGSSVESLSKVSLNFETDMLDALPAYGESSQYSSSAKQITVSGTYGDSVTNCVWAWTTDYKVIDLKLASTITAPGTYYITLPDSLVTELDENWNVINATKATKLEFKIEAPDTLSFIATPASGSSVTSLSEITLTFPTDMIDIAYAYSPYCFNPDDALYVPVLDAAGNEVAKTSCTNSYTSYYDVILKLDTPITANGTYTIPVPKGLVTELDENWNLVSQNAAATLTITVGESTGITSIESGKLNVENADVYNLAGQRVNSNTKGLVIKNGKLFIER